MKLHIRKPGVNFLIAVILVAANLLTWGRLLSALVEPYTVEPICDPEIVELLAYIHSGEHSGEMWELTLTELEAEQTITWYLQRYPQIPFAHPHVEITPEDVGGGGDATIAGLRVHIGIKTRITLEDGLPQVKILALSLPMPEPIRQALETELQRQIRRADSLPVRFTEADWRAGEVTVRGYIR